MGIFKILEAIANSGISLRVTPSESKNMFDNVMLDEPSQKMKAAPPQMNPKEINQVLPRAQAYLVKDAPAAAPKIEEPKPQTPHEKFLSGLDNLSKSAKAPAKAFEQPYIAQPIFTNEEQRKILMDQADAKLRQEMGKEPAPVVIKPTNQDARKMAMDAVDAKFDQQPSITIIKSDGQKMTRIFDDEPVKLISAQELHSKLTVSPPDPDKPVSGQRMGLMNDMKKTDIILKALNEKFPDQSWGKESNNTNHDVQISNAGGKNSFEVKNDSMVTRDDNVDTFKAMLVGFQAAYKDSKPTITASPELETKWREAAKSVGVEINFKPAQPEVAKTATKTATGPAQTQTQTESKTVEAAPEAPRMRH